MLAKIEYLPGRCNIGAAEIRMRRRAGLFALAATGALFVLLLVVGAAPAWQLLLFAPAFGAAVGLFQAASRFCVHYAYRGMFNFGLRGRAVAVPDEADRRRDRAAARRITLHSALIAAVVALIGCGAALALQ